MTAVCAQRNHFSSVYALLTPRLITTLKLGAYVGRSCWVCLFLDVSLNCARRVLEFRRLVIEVNSFC